MPIKKVNFDSKPNVKNLTDSYYNNNIDYLQHHTRNVYMPDYSRNIQEIRNYPIIRGYIPAVNYPFRKVNNKSQEPVRVNPYGIAYNIPKNITNPLEYRPVYHMGGEIIKPKTAKPKTTKPKTAKPKTAKPKTAKPKTTKPKTAKPKTAKPKTAKPKK